MSAAPCRLANVSPLLHAILNGTAWPDGKEAPVNRMLCASLCCGHPAGERCLRGGHAKANPASTYRRRRAENIAEKCQCTEGDLPGKCFLSLGLLGAWGLGAWVTLGAVRLSLGSGQPASSLLL